MGSKLGSHHSVKRRPAIEKTCPVCNTTFKTWPSVNNTFCSRPCKYTGTALVKPMPCQQCGTLFKPRSVSAAEQQRGLRRLFCSRACYSDSQSGDDRAPDRCWKKVEKTASCWLWKGAIGSGGYGVFQSPTGRVAAHRYVWELTHGPIPPGVFVCHNCPGGDNPRCVRPDHLFLGTQADNMRDMRKKERGRTPWTNALVLDVKRRLALGERAVDLARELGVTKATIGKIKRGETWKHI